MSSFSLSLWGFCEATGFSVLPRAEWMDGFFEVVHLVSKIWKYAIFSKKYNSSAVTGDTCNHGDKGEM